MRAVGKSRTILGIDPGLATAGYGVIADRGNALQVLSYGTLRTPARAPAAERLAALERHVRALIKKFRPQVVAVERLFFNTNTTTAMAVSQARGAILVACGTCGVGVQEFTPLQVKHTVTGYGRADKRQMQRMTAAILKLAVEPRPDDAADALAVAICGARSLS